MHSTKMKVRAEAKQGRGYIRITDTISVNSETGSAAAVRLAVDSFLRDGINKATVYVSSQGGDVFEANDIENELDRLDEVELVLGAMAASAVTKWVAKYYTIALASTKIMIHKPKLTSYGNHDKIKGDLKLLEDLTNDYRSAYAVKMGISEVEVDALWDKGDKWITAPEALKMKLINAINAPRNTPLAIHEAMLTACANCETEIPETQNNLKMDRIKMISALGLAADATDEQILEAAQQARTSAQALSVVNQQKEADKKVAAKALVTAAVKDKKLKADLADTYEAFAVADFEGTKTAIEAMVVVPKLSGELGGDASEAESRKDWTFAIWQDKDPKGLEKMAHENAEEFDKLFNA